MCSCPLTEEAERSLPPIYMEGPTLVWNTTARGDDVGFYNIKFANCISDSTVSFDLTLVAYNARGNNDSALLCRGEPRGEAVALFCAWALHPLMLVHVLHSVATLYPVLCLTGRRGRVTQLFVGGRLGAAQPLPLLLLRLCRLLGRLVLAPAHRSVAGGAGGMTRMGSGVALSALGWTLAWLSFARRSRHTHTHTHTRAHTH